LFHISVASAPGDSCTSDKTVQSILSLIPSDALEPDDSDDDAVSPMFLKLTKIFCKVGNRLFEMSLSPTSRIFTEKFEEIPPHGQAADETSFISSTGISFYSQK